MSKEWLRKPKPQKTEDLEAEEYLQADLEAEEYLDDLSEDDEVNKAITEYLNTLPEGQNVVVMNDGEDMLYFMPYTEAEHKPDTYDVAVRLEDDRFIFLPKDIAQDLTSAYVDYLTVLTEAKSYLELTDKE